MSILGDWVHKTRQEGTLFLTVGPTFELTNEYGDWLWDVTTATDIALHNPKICLLNIEPLRGHVYDPAIDPEPDEPRFPINAAHALHTTNTAPIVLLEIARPDDPNTILFETIVDGWHRTYRALATGAIEIPARIVPARLEPLCRLYHTPPTQSTTEKDTPHVDPTR